MDAAVHFLIGLVLRNGPECHVCSKYKIDRCTYLNKTLLHNILCLATLFCQLKCQMSQTRPELLEQTGTAHRISTTQPLHKFPINANFCQPRSG